MAIQKCGIYSITHVASGKLYVGQSSKMRDRWLFHRSALRRGVHSNRPLQNAWNKYGEAAFAFAVLELVALDDALLCEREQYWIDTLKPAYNVAPVAGTTRGMKHPPRSAEFRERMRAIKTGFKHSEESLARMRAIPGRPLTPEQRAERAARDLSHLRRPESVQKRREKMVGRKQSQAAVEKRRASLIGQRRTPDQCKRISDAKRAANAAKAAAGIEPQVSPMKGRQHSDEAKRRISEAKRGVPSGRGSLSPEQVREIRSIRASEGIGYKAIAKRLQISPGAAYSVIGNHAYQWVA